MKAFFRELLDPSGKISFMRFVAFPIITVGLFMVVYGLLKSNDVGMYVGGTLVALGVTGKAAQKGIEMRRQYPLYQQPRQDAPFIDPGVQ